MIFVIDRSKSTLRFRAGVLELEQKGRKIQRIPLNPLEQVVIYGNPLVETTVWRVLNQAGVPVIILPDRKRPAAMLGSGLCSLSWNLGPRPCFIMTPTAIDQGAVSRMLWPRPVNGYGSDKAGWWMRISPSFLIPSLINSC